MKCGITLIQRPSGKRGKIKVRFAFSWEQVWAYERGDTPLPIEEDKGDIVSVCDGDVEAGIFLEWEPFYGGCDPRVDIRWKCDKCGFEHGHPELSTSMDDLSMLVTELLSHADSKILEKMKQDHMEYILSHERRMAEFVQEEEAQRKRNARPLPG